MRIAVTGAAGFTGRRVVSLLAEQGHEVIAVGRGPAGPVPGAAGFVEQDLAAPLGGGLPAQVDSVVHLAQSRRYREWPAGATDVFEVNAAAAVRLADWCRGAGGSRFVYASSGAVYAAGAEPKTEAEAPDPSGFYGRSKLAGEIGALGFADQLDVSVLRFFFIYGPGQEAMFLPGLIGRVRAGDTVTVAGPDGIRVNPVHVDDAARAVVAAATTATGSGPCNVAGPQAMTVRAIVERIAAALGCAADVQAGPPGGDLVADISRMRERLHDPVVTLDEGIAGTLRADG